MKISFYILLLLSFVGCSHLQTTETSPQRNPSGDVPLAQYCTKDLRSKLQGANKHDAIYSCKQEDRMFFCNEEDYVSLTRAIPYSQLNCDVMSARLHLSQNVGSTIPVLKVIHTAQLGYAPEIVAPGTLENFKRIANSSNAHSVAFRDNLMNYQIGDIIVGTGYYLQDNLNTITDSLTLPADKFVNASSTLGDDNDFLNLAFNIKKQFRLKRFGAGNGYGEHTKSMYEFFEQNKQAIQATLSKNNIKYLLISFDSAEPTAIFFEREFDPGATFLNIDLPAKKMSWQDLDKMMTRILVKGALPEKDANFFVIQEDGSYTPWKVHY
ncbi:MAG: hypothetical protein AB7O96_12920 [Pseudobdellovibrionaceae bacterium]